MTDYLLEEVSKIYEKLLTLGLDGNLVKTLEEFSGSIFRGISLIRDTVITPVAYSILGLFLLLELHHIIVRYEAQQGSMGVELPLKILFKAAIYGVVIDKIGLITNAIFGLTLDLITEIQKIMVIDTAQVTVNYAAIERSIDQLGFWQGFFGSVLVFLIGALVSITVIVVNVIVIARFFEIYVLLAISPLPIATLPGGEMSAIAKNFFKYFAAVCLHGVFIYIVMAMFPLLITQSLLGTIDGSDFKADLFKILGYCFVLLVSITASSRWAKSICNAM